MRVALVREVFPEEGPALEETLAECARRGAELAVLPELPLNPWCPAFPESRPEDEEPPEGPRHRRLAAAARSAGLAVVGGAIVAHRGVRHNTALVFDSGGRLVHQYRKIHLPSEEGFWEDRHYCPGADPPQRFDDLGFALGLQICSDTNRPFGSALLAAQGVGAILIPRATEARTIDRWRLVFQGLALTGSCYVLSVSRPGPEFGVPLGGPSLVVDPDGRVLAESLDRVLVSELDLLRVEEARRDYPGYLPFFPGVYAHGWGQMCDPDHNREQPHSQTASAEL